MALAALAACIAFIVYAGNRAYGTIGPSRAAVAADGRLFLLSHGKIHAFSSEGRREQVADLASIGAPPRPSDFELHRDGRLLLTNPDAPELVRCAWPAGPCEHIAVSLKSLPAQEVLPLNAAKLHIDEAGQRYFISDNAGHRLLVTDFSGALQSSTVPGIVRHPNQLSLSAADRLTVVDTDHRQRVTFDVPRGRIGSAVERMSTDAKGVVRPGRIWPFDSVRLPGGESAMLIATAGMRDADLVFFDAAGRATRRARLADDADPFDIELWRGRLWVADATRYRFAAIGLDGNPAPGLEDTSFLAELESEREKVQRWKELRRFAQYGIVAIPLFGALILWKLGDSVVSVPARATRERIEWIEPRPVLMRRVRFLAQALSWLILAGMVAWCAYFLVRFENYVFAGSGITLLGPMLAMVVLAALLMFGAYRTIPRRLQGLRLGITVEALHYTVPRPRWLGFTFALHTGSAPWPEVYMAPNHLLVGSQLVLLRPFPFGRLFDAKALAPVAERVPKPNRVATRALIRIAFKKGAIERWPIVVVIVLTAAMVAWQLRRLL